MIKLKEFCGEFYTLYDEEGEEIVVFQSSNFDELKQSVCSLLDYLGVKYEIVKGVMCNE